MTQAKWCFLITGLLAMVSLVLFLSPIPPLFAKADDVLLAVFSGSLLASLVAMVEYHVSRRMAIEEFAQRAEDVLHSYRRIKRFDVEWSDVKECARSYLSISDRELRDLGNSYSRLDFLFANKSIRRNAYIAIYRPLHEAYLIAAQKRWHFENDYNRAVWTADLIELNRVFFGENGAGKWMDVEKSLDEFCAKVRLGFTDQEDK